MNIQVMLHFTPTLDMDMHHVLSRASRVHTLESGKDPVDSMDISVLFACVGWTWSAANVLLNHSGLFICKFRVRFHFHTCVQG